MKKLLLLIEPILIIFIFFFTICFFLKYYSSYTYSQKTVFITFFTIYCILFLACITCHILFFVQMIYYDFSNYECSDKITNEILRKENLNTKKTILFTAINLIAEVIIIFVNVFPLIYPKCKDCRCDCSCDCCDQLKKCCDCFYNFIKCKKCKKKIVKNKNKNNENNKKYILSENKKIKMEKIDDINYINNTDNADNKTDSNIEKNSNNLAGPAPAIQGDTSK